MPDRLVRDELLDSDRYVGLSSDTARMLFVHFLLVADDLGNSEASNTFIRRRLLPHASADEAIAKIISELADADLVRVYEANGKRYVHVPRFGQRLRSYKRVNPRPPAEIECEQIKELFSRLPDNRQTSARQLTDNGPSLAGEEKRREEKRSTSSSAEPPPPGFARFWEPYPKKVAKHDAIKAFRTLKPNDVLLDQIIADVKRRNQSPDWMKDGGKFIPLPATYLRGARWEDEGTRSPTRWELGA